MRRNRAVKVLMILGPGLIGTIQYHAAQFVSRFDTFFGDRGDARGFVYFCEHWYQAFLGKANLLSPGIFYPTTGTLAYSDLLFGFAIPYSLLRAFGLGMFSAVELVIIALTFLTYVACFILLNRVLRFDLLPSSAGAMFFAFSSPKFFQTGHLQLQFVLFLPVIFIFIVSFCQQAGNISQKKATWYLSLAALFLLLQLATAFYYAWFFVLWSFLFCGLALVFRTSRVFILAVLTKYWRPILAGTGVFLVGFIPFLLIYLPTIRVGTWYSYQNVSQMIPEWWSLLSLGDGNYLWGWLSAAIRPNPWPATWGELMIGTGLVPSLTWIALTVYALRLVKNDLTSTGAVTPGFATLAQRKAAGRVFFAVMILATTIFYLLGIKYWKGYSPWYLVYGVFPGAGAIRAMSRYVIFLTLPMAIGFTYVVHSGLRWALKQSTHRYRILLGIAIGLLTGFGIFEQFGAFKVGGTGFSKRVENAYLKAMVSKLPHDCKAFYVAAGRRGSRNAFEYQYDAMLISIMSGIPTLNASSSQFPPSWQPLYQVNDPHYEANVKEWIDSHNLDGGICRLEIGPQVEAFNGSTPNPIDDSVFFVRQQYRDFTGREPTTDEVGPVASRLKNCQANDPSCDRVAISLELFRSTGMYDKGSLILRLYELGVGREPRFEEFMSYLRRFDTYSGTETAKDGLISEFTGTAEFLALYQGLSNEEYARKLLENAQLRTLPSEVSTSRDQTRAMILRKLTECEEISSKLLNREFVILHYFAYLRRDPEPDGFARWLETLNKNRDFKAITSGFINSQEYRERFSM